MLKMTSAYANKLLKQLNEEKEFWRKQEDSSCLYRAALGEEPVIPEYDYASVAATIEDIDEKICKIKHAVNLANVTSQIPVGDKTMSVDVILVRMAQLSKRKGVLDIMRKQKSKTRLDSGMFARQSVPEYQYINYDPKLIKQEYERVDREIMEIQIALDKYNQTFEFEVDL